MNTTQNTLTAVTIKALTFTRHSGQNKNTETFPAGTLVTLEQGEMESNPKFFNIQIADAHNTQTYAAITDIAPA